MFILYYIIYIIYIKGKGVFKEDLGFRLVLEALEAEDGKMSENIFSFEASKA